MAQIIYIVFLTIMCNSMGLSQVVSNQVQPALDYEFHDSSFLNERNSKILTEYYKLTSSVLHTNSAHVLLIRRFITQEKVNWLLETDISERFAQYIPSGFAGDGRIFLYWADSTGMFTQLANLSDTNRINAYKRIVGYNAYFAPYKPQPLWYYNGKKWVLEDAPTDPFLAYLRIRVVFEKDGTYKLFSDTNRLHDNPNNISRALKPSSKQTKKYYVKLLNDSLHKAAFEQYLREAQNSNRSAPFGEKGKLGVYLIRKYYQQGLERWNIEFCLDQKYKEHIPDQFTFLNGIPALIYKADSQGRYLIHAQSTDSSRMVFFNQFVEPRILKRLRPPAYSQGIRYFKSFEPNYNAEWWQKNKYGWIDRRHFVINESKKSNELATIFFENKHKFILVPYWCGELNAASCQ